MIDDAMISADESLDECLERWSAYLPMYVDLDNKYVSILDVPR